MKITKSNFSFNKTMGLMPLAILLLLVMGGMTPVGAQPDGLSSDVSNEGKLFLEGTVTKDITNVNNPFQGTYGDGKTFDLGDNSTGLGDFGLQKGQITTYGESGGYGNITANPAEIVHNKFNESGYLDKSKWTDSTGETSANVISTSYSSTNDVSGAPEAMRVIFNSGGSAQSGTNTYIEYNIASAIPTDKYFTFGAYINSESINTSDSISVVLGDDDGDYLSILLKEGVTDYSLTTSGTDAEHINFDDDAGDVIFVQVKLSEWDGWKTAIDFNSVSNVMIGNNMAGSIGGGGWADYQGSLTMDIFELGFHDVELKAGEDRNDQVTSDEDYVLLNVTNPSTPNFNVRDLDSSITKIVNADIDFITEIQQDDVVYDDVNFRVTEEYEFKLATPTTWQDKVTLSNMKAYHILDRDYDDFTTYAIDDVDSLSTILNEGAGDAITWKSTVVEDTTYRLKYAYELTESEFDALVASDGSGSGLSGLSDWVLGILSTITIFGIGKWARSSLRSNRTERANRR